MKIETAEKKRDYIAEIETNLRALQRYLQYVDNDMVNGWKRDICILEVKHRVDAAMRAYELQFDA